MSAEIGAKIGQLLGIAPVIPDPTLETAMRVLEQMRVAGYGVNIHSLGEDWTVFFQTPGGDNDFLGGVRCKSLVESICRSALVAVGQE